MSNLLIKIENITKRSVSEGGYGAEESDGVLFSLIFFVETPYNTVIQNIKKEISLIFKTKLKEDLEDYLRFENQELNQALFEFLNKYIISSGYVRFDYHPDSLKISDSRLALRTHFEHLYIDLFLEDPDFKPELIKLVELKKTQGVQ